MEWFNTMIDWHESCRESIIPQINEQLDALEEVILNDRNTRELFEKYSEPIEQKISHWSNTMVFEWDFPLLDLVVMFYFRLNYGDSFISYVEDEDLSNEITFYYSNKQELKQDLRELSNMLQKNFSLLKGRWYKEAIFLREECRCWGDPVIVDQLNTFKRVICDSNPMQWTFEKHSTLTGWAYSNDFNAAGLEWDLPLIDLTISIYFASRYEDSFIMILVKDRPEKGMEFLFSSRQELYNAFQSVNSRVQKKFMDLSTFIVKGREGSSAI